MQDRLETLRESGVERYFAYLVLNGKHCFESATLGTPRADLLGPLMEAGKRANVQIHPVLGLGGPINMCRNLYQPPLEFGDVPERVLNWACAAWGENHERLVRVADELLTNYGPAGIHLDYVRYPDANIVRGNPCTCERCQQVRLRWLGKPCPEPEDMRKPGVLFKEMQMRMEFVRSFVESMRGITDHHGAHLSAAVRPRYCEDALDEGQDWPEWCADGLLDEVYPLTFTLSFGTFARLVAQHRRLALDTPVRWLEGIGLAGEETRLDFDAFERQIRLSLKSGADGVCIRNADALGETELEFLAGIADGLDTE